MSNIKTATIEMYLHRTAEGVDTLLGHDFTDGGTDIYFIKRFGVCMGVVKVECSYEDIDADPVERLIDALECKLNEEIADSEMRKNILIGKISELKAITYQAN